MGIIMGYSNGDCTDESVFSWEDFVDPISGDLKPKEKPLWV